MPALVRHDTVATITWLGRVPDRDASLRSEPLQQVLATLAGFEGEAHGGLTRPSCSRVSMLHPKGTEIRNTRQISILAAEDLAAIAADLGLETLDPGLIGASLVVSGIPDLSHLPPGTRLRASSGATVTVDLENGPCQLSAREIEADAPGHGKGFVAAARGRRGVTGWVERTGLLAVGDALDVFLPAQPVWAPTRS